MEGTNDKKPKELAEELQAIVRQQLTNFKNLQETSSSLHNKKDQINDFFLSISQKIIELYTSSFELIDLYGDFYQITERIWVTCDNIFR